MSDNYSELAHIVRENTKPSQFALSKPERIIMSENTENTDSQFAEQEAMDALADDEIALRIRALGMSMVRLIAASDANQGQETRRAQDNPAIQTLEAGLDLLDVYMHDIRRMADAQEKIARELETTREFFAEAGGL